MKRQVKLHCVELPTSSGSLLEKFGGDGKRKGYVAESIDRLEHDGANGIL